MGLTKNPLPTVTANAYITRESAIGNPRKLRHIQPAPHRRSGLESVGSLAMQLVLRVYGEIDTATLWRVAKGEAIPADLAGVPRNICADSVIDNTAAEIASLVGPNDEAKAVQRAVVAALVFLRSVAGLRLREQSRTAPVTVRPLEWREEEPDWFSAEAFTFRCGYEAWKAPSGTVRVRMPGDAKFSVFGGTLDEAKAACERDYVARVRACLQEPSSLDELDRLRNALRDVRDVVRHVETDMAQGGRGLIADTMWMPGEMSAETVVDFISSALGEESPS